MQIRRALGVSLLMSLVACSLQAGTPRSVQLAARPLAFEENRGQTDPQVRFLSRGDGYSLFLAPTEAVLTLYGGDSARVLRLRWIGAHSTPRISGEGELPGRSHYLLGSDAAKWRTGISSYQKVRYESVYPGVDLVFYGKERQLEYDFVLAPGADPKTLRLVVEGPDRLTVDAAGDLVLHLGGGEVRLKRPVSYQESGGLRREVASRYRLLGPDHAPQVGFEVAAYDPDRPLVIDPILSYSTYLGGNDVDSGRAIAVDADGNAYITGLTRSPDFPVVAPMKPFPGSFLDAFVTKLDPDGTPVYSTFLGGFGDDRGYGIAVDGSGNAYVTGPTVPVGFPLVNSLPASFSGAFEEVFVSKLDPTGSSLVYSTTFGGAGGEQGNGIAVDSQGSAYVTGTTFSPDFPLVNPLPGTQSGGGSAFVAKLSPGGSQLLYSTYLGGSEWEEGYAIAVDLAGHAYVTGFTFSSDFPTVNALQSTYHGPIQDVFVSKLLPGGSGFVYSTYLGGGGGEVGYGIAADASGNGYVTGFTGSPDFPILNALQPVLNGWDVFITKLSPGGSLVYSTYLGGSDAETALAIALDPSRNVYITGYTQSVDYPVKDPVQAECSQPICLDAFVTKVNAAGSGIVYSTYLGGGLESIPTEQQAWDFGRGIAIDPSANAYIAGETYTTDFPTANAFQPTSGGDVDAFVAKVVDNQPPVCSAAFATPATIWPPNGKLVPVTISGVTDPDGDAVAVTVTAIRQDEAPGRRGPDATGIGTPSVSVRSDRDGKGNGRVYHVTFSASDGQGGSCTGTVRICVPHDQGRRTCGDGGALFDSTVSGR